MGTTTRRARERENLTALILEGARRVFVRDGQGGLSIRKVAKEIEYSPGTIYLYYKDKDALMLALHEDAFRRKSQLFAPLASITDPRARLEAMGRAYISHALNDPGDFHLMFVDKTPLTALEANGQEWRSGNAAFQMLISTIAQGVETGHFDKCIVPEQMAVVLWSMVHGCAMLILSERLGMLDAATQQSAIDDLFNQVNRLTEPR